MPESEEGEDDRRGFFLKHNTDPPRFRFDPSTMTLGDYLHKLSFNIAIADDTLAKLWVLPVARDEEVAALGGLSLMRKHNSILDSKTW